MELEAQMARMRPPAQELEQEHEFRGQQAAPMIPRPLQVGASEQQHPMGNQQVGQPQMATRGAQPQMAPPTCAQVAQMPPTKHYHVAQRRLVASKKLCMTNGLQMHPKHQERHVVPRAQGPPTLVSDL